MPSNLSPSSQWTHLMGKGQSCHGDPQGIRHHRSRGLKMCLCNSKHTLCTDTNRDRRNREEKGLEKEVKKLQRAVATEAEMHNGGQAWNGEKAAWLPSQKDGWKHLKRNLSQVLHCMRVSLTSRWKTQLSRAGMTWQNKTLNQALVCL